MTVPALAAALAIGLADVSLTIMLIGAIVLAGATVVMTTLPDRTWPFTRHREDPAPPPAPHPPAPHPPAPQRRVVTGRAVVLPPPGTPLPRQAPAVPDDPRPTNADVVRAEAMIDHFLDTDPEILAATITAWIAQDDKPTHRRHP